MAKSNTVRLLKPSAPANCHISELARPTTSSPPVAVSFRASKPPPRNRPPGTAPPNGCTVRMFELPGPAVKNADEPPKNCVSKRNRSNVTSRPDKYSVSNCCW